MPGPASLCGRSQVRLAVDGKKSKTKEHLTIVEVAADDEAEFDGENLVHASDLCLGWTRWSRIPCVVHVEEDGLCATEGIQEKNWLASVDDIKSDVLSPEEVAEALRKGAKLGFTQLPPMLSGPKLHTEPGFTNAIRQHTSVAKEELYSVAKEEIKTEHFSFQDGEQGAYNPSISIGGPPSPCYPASDSGLKGDGKEDGKDDAKEDASDGADWAAGEGNSPVASARSPNRAATGDQGDRAAADRNFPDHDEQGKHSSTDSKLTNCRVEGNRQDTAIQDGTSGVHAAVGDHGSLEKVLLTEKREEEGSGGDTSAPATSQEVPEHSDSRVEMFYTGPPPLSERKRRKPAQTRQSARSARVVLKANSAVAHAVESSSHNGLVSLTAKVRHGSENEEPVDRQLPTPPPAPPGSRKRHSSSRRRWMSDSREAHAGDGEELGDHTRRRRRRTETPEARHAHVLAAQEAQAAQRLAASEANGSSSTNDVPTAKGNSAQPQEGSTTTGDISAGSSAETMRIQAWGSSAQATEHAERLYRENMSLARKYKQMRLENDRLQKELEEERFLRKKVERQNARVTGELAEAGKEKDRPVRSWQIPLRPLNPKPEVCNIVWVGAFHPPAVSPKDVREMFDKCGAIRRVFKGDCFAHVHFEENKSSAAVEAAIQLSGELLVDDPVRVEYRDKKTAEAEEREHRERTTVINRAISTARSQDWTCRLCGNRNAAGIHTCSNCRTPKAHNVPGWPQASNWPLGPPPPPAPGPPPPPPPVPAHPTGAGILSQPARDQSSEAWGPWDQPHWLRKGAVQSSQSSVTMGGGTDWYKMAYFGDRADTGAHMRAATYMPGSNGFITGNYSFPFPRGPPSQSYSDSDSYYSDDSSSSSRRRRRGKRRRAVTEDTPIPVAPAVLATAPAASA